MAMRIEPQAAPPAPYRRIGRKRRPAVRHLFSYVCLTLIAAVMIAPFLWTLSTSLKGQNEALYSMPPRFIPELFTLENYATVWNSLPLPLYVWNSTVLAFFGVLLPVVFCSMAAFPLARMTFRGKEAVFLVIIATMMIPGEVTMIPVYLILNKLHLLGSYTGVILPAAVSAFGIFLMRQGFLGIPKEIEESAVIDGAGVVRIFLLIMMPMVRPMLATLAILSFIGSWNNFLWPYLVIEDDRLYPLTLGLYKLKGTFVTNTRLIAAGSVIALLPVLAVFIGFQSYFIKGVQSGAVKG
ncbi:carbohydrate ABC transporter permease [Paenibacillus sp. UNC499MF]|uniref:carbohydrate ABC transporter permease n=1 Tax=Paenibacillus sp. UNC499MF TaxID=1502751 RepID=UPI0008A05362|nr:carbohydrate ABC transporter permease [Paenibacillus sp. UNC499MF]SEF66288.1 putative chitobiose transport system permease protein [Paenibacillus sp. UNC499MF]